MYRIISMAVLPDGRQIYWESTHTIGRDAIVLTTALARIAQAATTAHHLRLEPIRYFPVSEEEYETYWKELVT